MKKRRRGREKGRESEKEGETGERGLPSTVWRSGSGGRGDGFDKGGLNREREKKTVLKIKKREAKNRNDGTANRKADEMHKHRHCSGS